MVRADGDHEHHLPLYETREAKGRGLLKLYVLSVFVSICGILYYRATHIPRENSWLWIGLFGSELWFTFYWFVTVSVRWRPLYRRTFTDRLSQRFEAELPGMDIFVCTADPKMEPPTLVVNTILSMMAYNYPPEKLSVYLSDDGGSELTFYALLEASEFSKHWIPFCKKHRVEPRSPSAYFSQKACPGDETTKEWLTVKKLYEEMENRIETIEKLGRIPEKIRKKHKGFQEWNSGTTRGDHQVILEILLRNRDSKDVDIEGFPLPTLVYLSREKRPQYPHHFKAGAMNALVDLHGFDGFGGPLYIGSGCFHRRESLSGRKYSEEFRGELKGDTKELNIVEEKVKSLASCSYEDNSEWGKEMGLKYGCAVEDVITGLAIHCRGWKSIYFNPNREGFVGIAPTTLEVTLVQHKRWTEGNFQIFLSKYCPFIYGYGKIEVGLRMAYCNYHLWAPNCLPTVYYVVFPSHCFLHGISLFPRFSNPWFIPFAYVAIAVCAYDLGEALYYGRTLKDWWNAQRMWMIKRTTSYLLGFMATILKQLGFTSSAFALTNKAENDEAEKRYEKEIMEFGSSSPMFALLATLALFNLVCFIGGIKRVITYKEDGVVDHFLLQFLLCGFIVILNQPIYQGLFFRIDSGRIPITLTFASISLTMLITCLLPKLYSVTAM